MIFFVERFRDLLYEKVAYFCGQVMDRDEQDSSPVVCGTSQSYSWPS